MINFNKLVINEIKSKQKTNGLLGSIVTDTGAYHSSHGNLNNHPHYHSDDCKPCAEDDCTTSKQAQNKMGKHTRGNCMRSGKTGSNNSNSRKGKLWS